MKEDTSAPNVREVTKCCVFSMIRVSGQSKSRPVKAAGCGGRCSEETSKIARHCGEKHILKSKCTKRCVWTTFVSSDVGKIHAAVAKSTF